jgi:hypothetical protein
MATTYEAIATVTVGSGGAANIEFTSIPQTYTDLVMKTSLRSTLADTEDWVNLQFNNSGGTAYSLRILYANGTSALSLSTSSAADVQYSSVAVGDNSTASTFSNAEYYIPNYTSSNNKSVSIDGVSEANATKAFTTLNASLWANSAAITSIKIFPDTTGNLAQYSTATLYGIKNS